MNRIILRFILTATVLINTASLLYAADKIKEQESCFKDSVGQFYVVKVTNDFSAYRDCAFSATPTWDNCRYVWTLDSCIKIDETESRSVFCKIPTLDGLSLEMFYRINHFDGHSNQKKKIKIESPMAAIDPVKDINHCGFRTEGITIHPYIYIDKPVDLNVEGSSFVTIDEGVGVNLHISSNEAYSNNFFKIEWLSDAGWKTLHRYEGNCTANGTVSIRYEDIFGYVFTEEYQKYIGSPIQFRIVKTMIDGSKQYSNSVRVYFFKKAPEFSIVKGYKPACETSCKYVIVKLNNPKEEVFISCDKWEIGTDNIFQNAKVDTSGNGSYSIRLQENNKIDYNTIRLSGFVAQSEADSLCEDVEKYNSYINQPFELKIDDSNLITAERPAVSQNVSLRDYYGGYDDIRTGRDISYYANLNINDNSEDYSKGVAILYRKSGSNDFTEVSAMPQPYEFSSEEIEEIKESFKNDAEHTKEKLSWKFYYKNNYFDLHYRELNSEVFQIPSINTNKIEISDRNIKLLMKINNDTYRITSNDLERSLIWNLDPNANYYQYLEVSNIPSGFVSDWLKNISVKDDIICDEKSCYKKVYDYRPYDGYTTAGEFYHCIEGKTYMFYATYQDYNNNGKQLTVFPDSDKRYVSCRGRYLNWFGQYILLEREGSKCVELYDLNCTEMIPVELLSNKDNYISSVMNKDMIAIVSKQDSTYKLSLFNVNGNEVRSWILADDITLLGVDVNYVYVKTIQDNKTYRIKTDNKDSAIYFERDRDNVFNQWMKNKRGYSEILNGYCDYMYERYVNQNYGTKLKLEPNIEYDVKIRDSDSCMSEPIKVFVKVPESPLNVVIEKNPQTECEKTGKVTLTVKDKGVTLQIRREGRLSYEELKYGTTKIYDDMSITDNVIYYRYVNQNCVADMEYRVPFEADLKTPSIEEIIPHTDKNSGIVRIKEYDAEKKYVLETLTDAVIDNEGSLFKEVSSGKYHCRFDYTSSDEGCYSKYSDDIDVVYRNLRIDNVDVRDASMIGGNGSVEITAGIYDGDIKDNVHKYVIVVDGTLVGEVNSPLTKEIGVGDHVARVYACDETGTVLGNGYDEKKFTVSQPHINATFKSVVDEEGNWAISLIAGENRDKLQLVTTSGDTVDFDSVLEKKERYTIRFCGAELVKDIICPAVIQQPQIAYKQAKCAGEKVECSYLFTEECCFNGGSKKSREYKVSTSENYLSFIVTCETENKRNTDVPQSSVIWKEIRTHVFEDENIPVIARAEVYVESKTQLDCVDQETDVFRINEFIVGADNLKYYLKTTFNNEETISPIADSNNTDAYRNGYPFVYKTAHPGTYVFEIFQGKCPSDTMYTLTVSEPQPIKIDYIVNDVICNGNDNGSIEVSEVSGGTVVDDVFSYAYMLGNDRQEELEKYFQEENIESLKSVFGNLKFDKLSAGDYTLNVYDANKCHASVHVTVQDYNNPDITEIESAEPVHCHGESNGRIKLGPINTQMYYYSHGIKNGNAFDNTEIVNVNSLICKHIRGNDTIEVAVNNAQEIEGLKSGAYILYVTDSKGCVSTVKQVEIDDIEEVRLVASDYDGEIAEFGQQGGNLSVTANGGNSTSGYDLYVDNGIIVEKYAEMRSEVPVNMNDFSQGRYSFYCVDRLHGCRSQKTNGEDIFAEFKWPDARLDFVTNIVDAQCRAHVGSIEVIPSGGWGDYDYSISRGEDRVGAKSERYKFAGLFAGEYNVTVYDKKGASVKKTLTVSEPDSLVAQYRDIEGVCGGSGSVVLAISGGTPDYETSIKELNLFRNGSEVSFDNLEAGKYTIRTEDKNKCVYERPVEIQDNSVKIESVKASCASAPEGKGTLCATVSGGSGIYTYTWLNTANETVGTEPEAKLPCGVYRLIVSDGNCEDYYDEQILSFNNFDLKIKTIKHETGYNLANGEVVLVSNTPQKSEDITVITDLQKIHPDIELKGNEIKLKGLMPGVYFVTSQMESCRFEINKYTPISVRTEEILNDRTTTDNSGSALFTIKNGVKPYKVLVNGNPVDMDGNSVKIESLPAGNYTLGVMDCFGNKFSKDFTILAPEKDLSFSVSKAPVRCFGEDNGSVSITADGGWTGYMYRLNDSIYTASNSFVGLKSNDYRIEVMDEYGVTVSDVVHIEQPEVLQVTSVSQDSVTCKGLSNGSVTINLSGGNGGYSIKLDSDNSFVKGTIYNGLSAGNHKFVVKDSEDCTLKDIEKTVLEPEVLSFADTVVTHTLCGENNGSISVRVEGGTLPYTYSWTENGSPMSASESTIKGLLMNGKYNLTVKDGKGCRESFSKTIVGSSSPRILDVKTSFVSCKDSIDGIAWIEPSDIQDSSPFAKYEIYWHDGQTGSRAVNLAEGTWNVMIKDENECSGEYTYIIESPDRIRIDKLVHRDAHCFGYSDGELKVAAKGGNGGYSFEWSNGDFADIADSLSAGQYKVVVHDQKGCVAESIYTISEPEELTVFAGEDITICPNNSFTFSCGSYATYEWKNSKGETLSDKYCLTVSDEDTYYLTVTDIAGCFAHDDVKLSIGNDALKTDFFMTSMATTSDTIVAIEMSNLPVDYMKWEYDRNVFERLEELEEEAYIINLKPGQSGTFDITLWAYSGGCTSLATHTLTIEEGEDNVDDISVRYEPLIKTFSVTPNRSDGLVNVYVELRESLPADLIVYDVADGRKVQMMSLDGNSRYFAHFDLSLEHKGIYIVTLRAMSEKDDVKILLK